MATTQSAPQTDTEVLYRTQVDAAQPEPVSTTIYEALAAVEGVAMTDLDIQLHDYLDLEAVESLLDAAPPTSDLEIAVTINAYTLSLSAGGELIVSPRAT